MEEIKCPKCEERVIQVKRYTDGDKLYVHQRSKKTFCYEVKGCYVKKEVKIA